MRQHIRIFANDTTDQQRNWWAWCLYDWANSAFATVILAAVLPVYFVSLVPSGGAPVPGMDLRLPATVLWSYAVALSMGFLVLFAPYLGAWADRHGRHLPLLAVLCCSGALATAGLAAVDSYWAAAGLFMFGNWCFAAGNILYNAYLPALAKTDSEKDLLSARGFAAGYAGGGLALLVVMVLILKPGWFGLPDPGAATRAGFVLTGLWWIGFALPVFTRLRGVAMRGPDTALPRGLSGYLRIFGEIRGHANLLRFLVAYLLYNDGIQTVIAVSAVFARETVGLSQNTVLGCFLMVQFVAAPGALVFGRLANRWGVKPMLLAALVLFMGVVVYAVRLETAGQFWILGGAVALVLGGSQALSRSLFARMVPEEKKAEFFGFFSISAKFAAIVGPFVFASVATLTGSVRGGLLFLLVFFLAGASLLWTVETPRAEASNTGAPS